MSIPRFRAWRFLHPDVDATDEFAGLQISPRGGIDMVADHASVRQAVFILLTTIPGERVMRPDYGCYLFRLIFSPNDDTTAGLAIYYVRQALARWEPRVTVLRLDANRAPEAPEQLNIDLEYRVRGSQQADHLTLALNLAGDIL